MQLSVTELSCVHRADPTSGIHTYCEKCLPSKLAEFRVGKFMSFYSFTAECRFLLRSTFELPFVAQLLLCPPLLKNKNWSSLSHSKTNLSCRVIGLF